MHPPVMVAAGLPLSHCATDTQLPKSGASAATQMRISDLCWSQAQATSIALEAQMSAVVGGLIGGGLPGMLGAAIGCAVVRNDSKIANHWRAPEARMMKRGYNKVAE